MPNITLEALPNLSALTVNTDAKRIRDELQSLFNSAFLKVGRLPREYKKLVKDIAEDFQKRPPPVGFKKRGFDERIFNLEDYALQELQTLFKEQALVAAAFVPSYESRDAVSPSEGIDTQLAEQIALAFFESSDKAPQEVRTLSEGEQQSELEDIEAINRLKAKQQAAAERQEPATVREQAQDGYIAFQLKQLEQRVAARRAPPDRNVSIAKYFATQNADLVLQLAHGAVDSFLSLPSSASQPFIRAAVQLVLQPVDASTYNPIADEIHMDDESDIFKARGSRYGRPASEQDISSLVASFCADLVAAPDQKVDQQIALSGCGTVYFDGMPVVKPELLADAARAIQMRPGMGMYTEYEIISEMGQQLVLATGRALRSRTEDELQTMGIVSKTAAMLKWSNVNALAFHRSAKRDEVLAGAVRTADGRAAPRMRAFAILLTDDTPGDGTAVASGASQKVALEPITRGGRSIQLEATVTVLAGGAGASMGEDAMP
tara:strand:- start:550 stop:2022 length:1473 start_codon:yes stop_codon:yes gene_type:complete